MFACFLANFLLLRGHFDLGRNFFTATIFVAIFSSLFLTGGFPVSIATPCLILLPVIAYLLYDQKTGNQMAAAVLSLAGLQWLAVEISGAQMPNFASTTHNEVGVVIAFLVAFITIQSGIAFYQRQNSKLNKELAEERHNLNRKANNDPLTDLYNHRYFCDRLDGRVADGGREPYAVVFVDLDDFKKINDGYGHHVGDDILQTTAARLKNCIREADIVARMGGDEFAILVNSEVSDKSLKELRCRIRRSICSPIVVDGGRHRVGASIGYAIHHQNHANTQHLLQQADQDMYRDKLLKARRLDDRRKTDAANAA